MSIGFGEALTVLGGLLLAASALSGLTRRTVLSTAVLALVAGVALGLAGVLVPSPGDHGLVLLVELVLLMTLFADGLIVEESLLRSHWHPAARALVLAMPLNAAMMAVAAIVLFPQLSWLEAFLLGFALSPTDPVVTSSVVSSTRVPPAVRHTLNLESGLNDGLALPFVLFFIAFASGSGDSAVGSAGELAVESVVGVGIGGALALVAGALLGRLPEWGLAARYEGLYALGLGLLAFGVADIAHGNGLIAAFVAGIVFAVTREEIPEIFHQFNENLSSVLQLIAFTVFGALVSATAFEHGVLPLAAFIVFALLVARPLSVLVSLTGVRFARAEKAFIAWFGPKGIASMLFALFILNSGVGERALIFDVAAFTILASIVAHGLTDTVASRWIEQRLRAGAEAAAD
jgi:NhaP-type Na+/H+ or K+/H+ antiporter